MAMAMAMAHRNQEQAVTGSRLQPGASCNRARVTVTRSGYGEAFIISGINYMVYMILV